MPTGSTERAGEVEQEGLALVWVIAACGARAPMVAKEGRAIEVKLLALPGRPVTHLIVEQIDPDTRVRYPRGLGTAPISDNDRVLAGAVMLGGRGRA